MLLLKKYLGLIVGLAVVALIVIVWQETAKIAGDVSAPGSTGAAVALSGARVTLYKVAEEQEQPTAKATLDSGPCRGAMSWRLSASQLANTFCSSSTSNQSGTLTSSSLSRPAITA